MAPNIQNIPKDGPLAEAFRRCLIARPGHKLVRGDLSSAEALLTGWLAQDKEYMRLSVLGAHKFYTAKFLGRDVDMSMGDAEIAAIIDPYKKSHPVLYRQIKTAIYGSTYLAGPRKIYENNPEEFESQGEAAKFQKFIRRPLITKWQNETIARATKEKALTNHFGYRKMFWDLPGGDGPAAVAFLPQSLVAAIMRECMLQLWERESGQWMIWQIHDELVFDVPEEKISLVEREMEEVMNQPWPELGGLRIGVKIEVSDSLV